MSKVLHVPMQLLLFKPLSAHISNCCREGGKVPSRLAGRMMAE
jgi:hypothetical protein